MTGRGSLSAADRRGIEKALESLPADLYGIVGVRIRLRTDSPAVREFFARAYRWFPPEGGSRSLDLAAVFHPQPPGLPFAAAGEDRVDLSTSPSPENRAFLFLFESIMDRIDRAVLLHAGAASYRGHGIILAGPAFAGKSTLVRELIGRGFDFLSDDAAPIDRKSGMLLPYPRAVGVRKPEGGSSSLVDAGLPEEGVHELPHRWLVDPASMGARLPAAACPPRLLFYLDPWAEGGDGGPAERVFEIAFADEEALESSGAGSLEALAAERIAGRPFPSLEIRFAAGANPAARLADLWRRHRRQILFVEEIRAGERSSGSAVIEPCAITSVLLHLVRDVLNRGEEGLLMASHGGKVTSLAVELGALLKNVRAFRVPSGGAKDLADEIAKIASREIPA